MTDDFDAIFSEESSSLNQKMQNGRERNKEKKVLGVIVALGSRLGGEKKT